MSDSDKQTDPPDNEIVIPVIEETVKIEGGEEFVRRYDVHIEEIDTDGEQIDTPEDRNKTDSNG